MTKPAGFKLLEDRLPEGSSGLVLAWLEKDPVKIIISRPRQTKLGDFRPARNGRPASISVNGDLHPVEFLVTLAHEMAHVENHRLNGRRVMPHGPEWKHLFRDKLFQIIKSGILEDKFNKAIYKCFFLRERVASSSCSVMKRLIDNERGGELTVRLEDIPSGSIFVTVSGKQLIKGDRIRTRYKCREVNTKRIYTVHPMAEIIEYRVPE
jgi:hypothetical protein